VSRGGLKLAAALDAFGFDPAGRTCLDVGASTGGFTDVLLARGAERVYAVDVGHGQLHRRLRNEARVLAMEGTDARTLMRSMFDPWPDLIVCDVSFISLTLVLPPVLALASREAALVCLVKPQFETGPGKRAKGVVRSPAAHAAACRSIDSCIRSLGWRVKGTIDSPVTGGDGNCEFLVGAVGP
jgi:23S rRNA (cytidine1920-2'-O)/16S rRNA (cytidine1409-2'-O)-methyltransferase